MVFILWTFLVQRVDVQPVGQNGTDIVFAAFNCWFHKLTGVHMAVYTLTDWLGLVPVVICLFFGGMGLAQLGKRRSLFKVDPDILWLGIYYIIVKKYVTADLSTKERAFVLFRYLTEHCSWQLNQSSEAYQKNYGNEAYAALVMKKAACSGYAKAYTLLCEAANVPVRHVNANSWTHQWNEVKANGKWIKADAYGGTFADTIGIRKSLRTSDENQEQLVFRFTVER